MQPWKTLRDQLPVSLAPVLADEPLAQRDHLRVIPAEVGLVGRFSLVPDEECLKPVALALLPVTDELHRRFFEPSEPP